MKRIRSALIAHYSTLPATLIAAMTCIGFSAPGHAELIEITVEGTWEMADLDPTINPFGWVDGDTFTMLAIYDDTTFFNGDEGVTATIDPGINPGTMLAVILPYIDGGPQQLVFTHEDHIDVGFAPLAQIEFDGPDATSDPGVFRNFEIHVEFSLFGSEFDLDLFWDGLERSDMFNFTEGALAATGSGVDHLMVIPTPEPSAGLLLLSGSALLLVLGRRRARR